MYTDSVQGQHILCKGYCNLNIIYIIIPFTIVKVLPKQCSNFRYAISPYIKASAYLSLPAIITSY